MRPPSILMFERLFLVSLVLGVVSVAVGYEAMVGQLAREPGLERLGLGSEVLLGTVAIWLATYLLLWFLIARKASNVARWILALLSVLGALLFVPGLMGPWNLTLLLNLGYYAVELTAVACLFRADAAAWLKGERDTVEAVID